MDLESLDQVHASMIVSSTVNEFGNRSINNSLLVECSTREVADSKLPRTTVDPICVYTIHLL